MGVGGPVSKVFPMVFNQIVLSVTRIQLIAENEPNIEKFDNRKYKNSNKKKRGVEGFRLDFEASNRVVEKNLQIPILFD